MLLTDEYWNIIYVIRPFLKRLHFKILKTVKHFKNQSFNGMLMLSVFYVLMLCHAKQRITLKERLGNKHNVCIVYIYLYKLEIVC